MRAPGWTPVPGTLRPSLGDWLPWETPLLLDVQCRPCMGNSFPPCPKAGGLIWGCRCRKAAQRQPCLNTSMGSSDNSESNSRHAKQSNLICTQQGLRVRDVTSRGSALWGGWMLRQKTWCTNDPLMHQFAAASASRLKILL